MNTANLQLEGLYAAVSALMRALQQKGVITEGEIESTLAETEELLAADPGRPAELHPAHRDAILFPLRYLRLANRLAAAGELPSFTEVAARVGREKPERQDEDVEASEEAEVRRLEAVEVKARLTP